MNRIHERRQEVNRTRSGPSTSLTLLQRLRNPRNTAEFEDCWREFYDTYISVILLWCLRCKGLSAHEAEDVASDVMFRVYRAMESFEYDPQRRFRAWLRRVTESAVNDFWSNEKSRRPYLESHVADRPASESLLRCLDDKIATLELAEQTVRAMVSQRDWEIYNLLFRDGRSPEEIAEQFAVNRGVVDMVKWRMKEAIKKESARIENDSP